MAGTVMYTGNYAMDLENMFETPEEFIKFLYNIQDQEKREDVLCGCMKDENFIDWLENHTEDARFKVWRDGINNKKGEQWLYIEGLAGLELTAPTMKRRIQILCAQVFKDMPEFWILQDEHFSFYKAITEDGKVILNRKEEMRSLGKESSGDNNILAVTAFRKMIENIDDWMKNIKGKMLNNYVLYQAGNVVQNQETYGIACTDVRGYFVGSETDIPLPIGYLKEKKDSNAGKMLESGMDRINELAIKRVAQLAKEAEDKKIQLTRQADGIIKKSKKPGRIRSLLAIIQGVAVIIMLLRSYQIRAWDFSNGVLNLYTAVFTLLALLSIWQGAVSYKKCKFWKQLKVCISDAAGREKALLELAERFKREKEKWSGKETIMPEKNNIKDISYIQEKIPVIDTNLKKTAVPFVMFLVLAITFWPLACSNVFGLDTIDNENQAQEGKRADPEIQLKDTSSVNINDLAAVYPDRVEASSSLQSVAGVYYGPENLVDGDLTTSWQEGVDGYGEGEAIRFSFAEEKNIKTISINAGSWINSERYYANGRPKELVLVFSRGGTDVRSDAVTLEDKMEQQFMVLDEAVECDSIYIRIESVYTGEQYEDTVIAEVGMYEN